MTAVEELERVPHEVRAGRLMFLECLNSAELPEFGNISMDIVTSLLFATKEFQGDGQRRHLRYLRMLVYLVTH